MEPQPVTAVSSSEDGWRRFWQCGVMCCVGSQPQAVESEGSFRSLVSWHMLLPWVGKKRGKGQWCYEHIFKAVVLFNVNVGEVSLLIWVFKFIWFGEDEHICVICSHRLTCRITEQAFWVASSYVSEQDPWSQFKSFVKFLTNHHKDSTELQL